MPTWTARLVTAALIAATTPSPGVLATPSAPPVVVSQLPAHALDRETTIEVLLRSVDLPQGSRIVLVERGRRGRRTRELTTGFYAAGRPDVSFDGERVLFIGKLTAGDPFGVWEIEAGGGPARWIVGLPGGCTEALYLSTIFTIDAERPEHQIGATCRGEDGIRALYTCRLDGSRLERITHHPFGARGAALLSDGRLLFALDREPAGGDRRRATELFGAHVDGTDLHGFATPAATPVLRTSPVETADGEVVFVEAPVEVASGPARLVSVSRTRSHDAPRLLTHEDGSFFSPAPLPGGGLLVSRLPANGRTSGIRILDGRRRLIRAPVLDDPDWHEADARLLAPRREPSGRSSSVDLRKSRGVLYGLDVRLTDAVPPVASGAGPVDRLRIYGDGSETNPEGVVLGEVALEEDGSFHLDVPARVPLRLETLDRGGTAVRTMRGWVWVMPGESRGCIGCHEDPELTPPNRHVIALWRDPVRVGLDPPPASGSGNPDGAAR